MSKILVVGGNSDVFAACRLVLEREGHEVHSAADAEDGLRAVESVGPDLLVVGIMVEEELDDGLRLARTLKRERSDRPIVMLTGVTQAMGLQIGKDKEIVPVDELLEMPVDPALLVKMVGSLLKA